LLAWKAFDFFDAIVASTVLTIGQQLKIEQTIVCRVAISVMNDEPFCIYTAYCERYAMCSIESAVNYQLNGFYLAVNTPGTLHNRNPWKCANDP